MRRSLRRLGFMSIAVSTTKPFDSKTMRLCLCPRREVANFRTRLEPSLKQGQKVRLSVYIRRGSYPKKKHDSLRSLAYAKKEINQKSLIRDLDSALSVGMYPIVSAPVRFTWKFPPGCLEECVGKAEVVLDSSQGCLLVRRG